MSRYEIHLINDDSLIRYVSLGEIIRYAPPRETKINQKTLNKIQTIRIYDNKKQNWVNQRFIEDSLYRKMQGENSNLKADNEKLKILNKELNDKVKYYKLLSEI